MERESASFIMAPTGAGPGSSGERKWRREREREGERGRTRNRAVAFSVDQWKGILVRGS